jgi:selenide,water dikinase
MRLTFGGGDWPIGVSMRNWKSYCARVTLPSSTRDWQRQLYRDPQTSGGLLVACAPDSTDALLDTIAGAGYPPARIIGSVADGESRVVVVET